MSDRMKIVVVGAGGLGHPACLEIVRKLSDSGLALAHLVIVDGDQVELSNLNRQFLFEDSDIGKNKAEALVERLSAARVTAQVTAQVSVGPELTAVPAHLNADTISEVLSGSSLVLDCTDHVRTKFLLNDYCALSGIPFCYAGAVELHGICLGIPAANGFRGCLRCLFGSQADFQLAELERTCQSAGIMGPVAGLIGTLQAIVALCLLNSDGKEKKLSGLFRFDGRAIEWAQTEVAAADDCPLGCALQVQSIIDLTRKSCPHTFLYTKLALEELRSGDVLDVRFSSLESLTNVSRSVLEEGHLVLASSPQTALNYYRLLVQKADL